ncbi:MAG: hypothetical protein EAZ35_02270 [Sphingobacteriia bacterium]|nr:MAG: hypothetical protein EAZ35_02270 [Sphingobacteriia bacterium]
MPLKYTLNQLVEIADNRNKSVEAFIKQLLLMSSSLLGILVALHKQKESMGYSHLFFVVALLGLGLGILLLSIALYEEVSRNKKLFLLVKKEIELQNFDDEYETQIAVSNPHVIFSLFQKLGYVSLIVSIICLTVYAVVIA